MKKIIWIIIISLSILWGVFVTSKVYAQCNPACNDPLICCTKNNSSACSTPAQCQSAWGTTTNDDGAFCSDPNDPDCQDEDVQAEENSKYIEYQKCLSQQLMSAQDCLCVFNGGIKLNTDFPFVGRCIEKSSDGGVITGIAWAFTNIFLTLIITVAFGMVIRAGVQFAMNNPAGGRKTIINVIIAFAALGSLGIILRLINPNFFK